MNIQEFFKKWTSTRPNLKVEFHEAGIESMAFAEAYYTEQLRLHSVSKWVAVKDALPDNDNQVFVKYENGKYGINEWWKNDNCWKYNFSNMIVKEWCKPPCC